MSAPQLKAAADVVAVPTAFLGWLKAIPFPEIAAALAGLYTLLRIAELVHGWIKRRKRGK